MSRIDGSCYLVDEEELEAAVEMFNRLLDGTLHGPFQQEKGKTMDVIDMVDKFRMCESNLRKKGYKSIYNYFSFDAQDMTFNGRITYEDEYGHSERAELFIWKDGTKEGGKRTYSIPLAMLRTAVQNMQLATADVPVWEDVKTERALAQLAKAIDKCDELGDVLSEDQLALIAQIREKMHALSSNALTHDAPQAEVTDEV